MQNATIGFRGSAAAMILAMDMSILMMISMSAGATGNHTMTDVTTENTTQNLHIVPFAWSEDIVTKQELTRLRQLVERLDPDRPLLLSGYTDSIGPDDYNRWLAQRRANAVSQALVSLGVPADLIGTRARGKQNYLGDNLIKEGRAQNRRVEIGYEDQWLRGVNGGLADKEGQRGPRRVADPLRVGRYSYLTPVPTKGQSSPLETLVHVTFPPTARTIGTALVHLLARSGWRLADPDNADPSMEGLVRLPLPESQRSLGPLRLIDAVKVLCGEPYTIVVDPVNRLISCELREPYANHWGPGDSAGNGKPRETPAKPEDDDPSSS